MDNYSVYEVRCRVPWYEDLIYIGLTKIPVQKRLWQHKKESMSRTKFQRRHFYNAMRALGQNNFRVTTLKNGLSREAAGDFEKDMITEAQENPNKRCLNMAPGGYGGFSMKDASPKHREEWIDSLRAARFGQKPALGMRHTPQNKEYFSKVSREYWDSKNTYVKNAEEIVKLSHKEAKQQYGVSTTHYYRLRKLVESSK